MPQAIRTFRRYALYFVPQQGAFARFGASWLGRDVERGAEVAHPDLPLPVAEITRTPRRYGLHGTIVPPFRMADDSPENMCNFVQTMGVFCTKRRPVSFSSLNLTRMGRFLALVPEGDARALRDLAAAAMEVCDPFRAALAAADLERHRARALSAEQEALLLRWGYPYVMDQFRFHITLTGKLPKAQLQDVVQVLEPAIAPLLPRPFVIDQLALMGEDETGGFYLIARFALER